MDNKVSFSNPRLYAKFEAWPLGFKKVGNCTFEIEHNPNKGWRVIKTTTGKPKLSTYGGRCCIVDGSDGKTYILQRSQYADAISVHSHDFKTPSPAELGFDHYLTFYPEDKSDPDYFEPTGRFEHDCRFLSFCNLINEAYNISNESTTIQGENK